MNECNCNGFKRSNPILLKIFKFAFDNELKILTKFKDCFIYCPWCGKKLKEMDEKEITFTKSI